MTPAAFAHSRTASLLEEKDEFGSFLRDLGSLLFDSRAVNL